MIALNINFGIEARGMTNRAVGEAIGSTEQQVWRWRKGRHLPELETMAALADVLFDGDMTGFYAERAEAA